MKKNLFLIFLFGIFILLLPNFAKGACKLDCDYCDTGGQYCNGNCFYSHSGSQSVEKVGLTGNIEYLNECAGTWRTASYCGVAYCEDTSGKCGEGYFRPGNNGQACFAYDEAWDWGACNGCSSSGKWDYSDSKCIKCDGYKEKITDGVIGNTSQIYWDACDDANNSNGNGKCESACGAHPDCDESNPGDDCGPNKECNFSCQCETIGCTIGGISYNDGEYNPSNKCQICDISKSTTAWSSVTNGTDPTGWCSLSWNSCDSKCVKKGGDGNCYLGACDVNHWTGNIASGYICTGSGNQTSVSSSNYCNYDENCDNGDCSATKWWTSCNGLGSCRSASDHTGSYSESVYANAGYTLTSACGTTGSTYCTTNQCRDGGVWHHKCSKRCDSAHSCNYWIDSTCVDHCTNGVQDCDETGVDSGGSCPLVCTRANPTVSLSPSSQGGAPGTTLSYTTTIINNDSSQCTDSTFNLTKSCLSGWTCSLSSNSKTISPDASASVTLYVTSPSVASAGNYTISVTATNSSAPSYSGTGSAIYTVTIEEFNFSININPTSGSVAQGGSVSANVITTLTSGATQPVSFSASNLPTGATAFSAPISCNPDCSTAMTINTSATTPVGGPYSINVCGTGGGKTHCVTYGLTITEAGAGIGPPIVTTNEATNITKTSATLNGTLNSTGDASSCLVWFEWGTDPINYGNSTPVQTMASIGTFSADTSGLSLNTTYYFEAKAKCGGSAVEALSPESPPGDIPPAPTPPEF